MGRLLAVTLCLFAMNAFAWEDDFSDVLLLGGQTWNAPALAGGRLYLRNAEEAVCYELTLAGEKP